MSEIRSSDQIRQDFFDFFQGKDHELVPSASLVPSNDPTLLFTNAGMNQFKDVFLETGTRPYKRAVDTQKCLRVSGKHNDLEEVGLDTYHHTFFEMLGNWSFGDYFKKEAIAWAWDLLVNTWGLEADRLYATVHEGDKLLDLEADTEAAAFWESETDINPEHILYCGSTDNFWMMGETGPCGPCSEIHIDLRSEGERARVPGKTLVNADDPRVMEIWNLVFIQYNALGDNVLQPLSAKHVDTGMGFERIVTVLQDKTSNYDTDLFSDLLDAIADLSPRQDVNGYDNVDLPEDDKEELRIAMRVIADHIRTVTFAIADGAIPGNVGRGYVIRRILRRAVRFGYQRLELREPFMYRLVNVLVDKMGHVFPEISESTDYIEKVVRAEEESFLETLGTGITFFERVVPFVKDLKEGGEHEEVRTNLLADRGTLDLLSKAFGEEGNPDLVDRFVEEAASGDIPGAIGFLLHDTYGFPIDLTQLMAREEGLGVDMDAYNENMKRQRDRARNAATFGNGIRQEADWSVFDDARKSHFIGYDQEVATANVLRFAAVDDSDVVRVVFDQTPFYAESGGQIGDTGVVVFEGEEVPILDTQKDGDYIVHFLERRPEKIEGPAELRIDAERRERIAKNHTATHLVHAALRDILGPHVTQKGSLVAPDRLRFDFNHFERVSGDTLEDVSRQVNEAIQRNILKQEERGVDFDEAISRGATALFGEKYGDSVRVITFDPEYSVELCGGTHVDATGEIGIFKFLSEGSVAAGIRRVEAVTGLDAVDLVQSRLNELERAKLKFKSPDSSLDEEIETLLDRLKSLQKEVGKLKAGSYDTVLASAIDEAEDIGGIQFAKAKLDSVDMDLLRDLGTQLRDKLKPEMIVLVGGQSAEGDKAYLVAVVSDDLKDRVGAGSFVGRVARLIDGGGGGRPEMATAGGNSPEKLPEAIAGASAILQEMLQPVS